MFESSCHNPTNKTKQNKTTLGGVVLLSGRKKTTTPHHHHHLRCAYILGDNINIFKNGRQPQFLDNGRRPQF